MGKLYIGGVLRDTVGQLKIGNTNVLKGYVGNVLVFPSEATSTTTTTTTTSTTTTTTTIAPTTTTTTSTTTTTTTLAPVNFTIAAGACSGGPGTGTITISAYTGGSGTYQITTTTYADAASALGGTFVDDVAPNTYTSVPNGTRYVAVRDKNNPSNSTAKSVAINCTTTTTTSTTTTTTTKITTTTTTSTTTTTTTAAPTTTTTSTSTTTTTKTTTSTTTTTTTVGTFTLNPAYGINITSLSVSAGAIPTFSYPANATSVQNQPMVDSYNNGVFFTVGLSGTRQFGTNKTVSLYRNSVIIACQVISADGSQSKVLTIPPHPDPGVGILDNLKIAIDNATSCP